MRFLTDVTPKTTLLIAGVTFALVVNFASPFTLKRQRPDDLSCSVEVVAYIEPHYFEVGSLSGGMQWAQVDRTSLPVIF